MKLILFILFMMLAILSAKMYTKDELLRHIKSLEEDNHQTLISRLDAFCAERAKKVEDVVTRMQALMAAEKKDYYDLFDVPLSVGFCAVKQLNDLSFYASYRIHEKLLRAKFERSPNHHYNSMLKYNDNTVEHVYRDAYWHVRTETIRIFFEEVEIQQEACKWRPCE